MPAIDVDLHQAESALAFTSSTEGRLFIPFPSSLLNGSRLKHTVPVSIGSFTFQESAPMPPHNHGTSESAAKENWRSGPPSATHFSSARQRCSDRTMRFSLPSSGSFVFVRSRPSGADRGLVEIDRLRSGKASVLSVSPFVGLQTACHARLLDSHGLISSGRDLISRALQPRFYMSRIRSL